MKNYLEINRNSWNNRLATHLNSEFYDIKGFLEGRTSLKSIELDLLGDVTNKKILHLQCHFGQDTISLSRLGAQVTGVDLSDKAIEKAVELAKKCDSDSNFICCDVYDLKNKLDDKFDIVYTTYGTISWLPDLNKWADIISHYLKPNGQFVFVEFHPVVWMFDDNMEKIYYPYFNKEAIVEEEQGTYADRSADIKQEYVCWNHGISEVMNSLIQKELSIELFNEYDYAPYSFVNGMVEAETGRYRIQNFGDKAPLVYAIRARKSYSDE